MSSKHRTIRKSVVWAVVLAAMTTLSANGKPVGCAASIFSPQCFGYQSGAGACSLSAQGTFNCLHGTADAPCAFCITFQLQFWNSATATWDAYTVPEADPWGQPCTSSQFWQWAGGQSGMPIGTYRLVVYFWIDGCGTYCVYPGQSQFDITG
jgi:hypothetical protein